MSIACSALMCHAPIAIPAIAGDRSAECRRTTRGMRQAAERLVTHQPDLLILVSPHATRRRAEWGLWHGSTLTGDFARFGRADLRVAVEGAPAAAAELATQARSLGLATWQLPAAGEMDHGTSVPLWFLQEAGLACPVLLVALPYPDQADHEAFGRALAITVERLGVRAALLASGDMSHRLKPGAPAGFDPRAQAFDDAFVARLEAGDLRAACAPDEQLQALAAEDVIDSCRVVAAAADFDSRGHVLLAYEGPFGVGYTEAILYEPDPPPQRPSEVPGLPLLQVAREAIAAMLDGRDAEPRTLPPDLQESRGVFVTLRSADGALRGCIGHITPTTATLHDEVSACARAAASQDPRFVPVTDEELPSLSIEVSVLALPEPVSDESQLDPGRYGVIVSQAGRRGVLLPDIPGVEDAQAQLQIAARKGGFEMGPGVTIERFGVTKYLE